MKTLILALAFVTSNAFAWGPTGHRAVGAVADRFLEPAVALKVFQILGGQNMARVSNWSDEIKSEPETYSHTYNWHYTDWKDGDHDHDETSSSGKLLTAINQQLAILKNPETSLSEKNFALKFVVHLVGDLHQPLHVGNGLDQGGNKCRVVFQKKEMNLHQLWDEAMIDFTNLSYTELANFVMQGRTKAEVMAWRQGNVVDWARESKELRGQVYPADVRASDAPMSVKQYCRSDIVIATEDMPKLSYEYSYKFVPVVEKRIYQAGLRLAVLLNQTLK